MNPTPPESPDHWEKLLRHARADTPPPIDLPTLLRTVRAAEPVAQPDWSTEFFALISARRVAPLCLTGAAACAALMSWQIWDVSQALPWAQLVATTSGGAP